MKKIFLLIIIISIAFLLNARDNFRSFTDGSLPRDASGNRVQSGKYVQLRDSLITNLEHLDQNTFASHTNWDVTNDIDDSGGKATWTWADGDASTLTQVNADMALVVRNGQSLRLTYDVSIGTAIAGGTVACYVNGICDSTALDLTAGTGKTLSIATGSSASTGDFVINVDPDASVTAGVFSLGNLYLTGYYESPVSIANGSDVTLYTPENAVEIVIDPRGTVIQIEIGSKYFEFDSLRVFPCSNDQNIKIANDSGGTTTVHFYFVVL